jgi:hypothetical protein
MRKYSCRPCAFPITFWIRGFYCQIRNAVRMNQIESWDVGHRSHAPAVHRFPASDGGLHDLGWVLSVLSGGPGGGSGPHISDTRGNTMYTCLGHSESKNIITLLIRHVSQKDRPNGSRIFVACPSKFGCSFPSTPNQKRQIFPELGGCLANPILVPVSGW